MLRWFKKNSRPGLKYLNGRSVQMLPPWILSPSSIEDALLRVLPRQAAFPSAPARMATGEHHLRGHNQRVQHGQRESSHAEMNCASMPLGAAHCETYERCTLTAFNGWFTVPDVQRGGVAFTTRSLPMSRRAIHCDAPKGRMEYVRSRREAAGSFQMKSASS